MHGLRVIGVRGRISRGGHTITGTLYVRAVGSPLPVELIDEIEGTKVHDLFSGWNEAVSVSAPAWTVSLT